MNNKNKMSERLKVLVLATTFPRWEGDTVPQFVYELTKELKQNELDLFVLAPHYPGAKRKEVMSGVTVYRYPYFVPYRYQSIAFQGNGGIVPSLKQSILALLQAPILLVSLLLHTVWIVNRESIDVINSHWLLPNGLIASFATSLFGVRHVLSLHAKGVLLLRQIPFASNIVSYVYYRSDAFLPVSTHIRDNFVKEGKGKIPGGEKFDIQPMGAHTNEYDLSLKSDLRYKKDLDGDVIGLFVGRLAEKKGVFHLLDAVDNKNLNAEDFQLVIVGKGPLEDELRTYATDLELEDQITFTGWVSENELHEWYVLSDFVLVPSIETETGDTEGMPTVIAEAFASGNPVIGTDVGGIPDVIKHGKNGFVVPQKRPDKLSETMQTLIDQTDLRHDLTDRALETAEELDWQRCGENYAQTIRSVVDSGRTSPSGGHS